MSDLGLVKPSWPSLFLSLLFLTKINDIHSFKSIEYIDTIQIAKKKKDESANELTISMSIA